MYGVKKLKKIKKLLRSKRVRKIALITLGVFFGLNLLVFVYFKHRTYPNIKINGVSLGNLDTKALDKKLDTPALLPTTVTFTASQKVVTKSTRDLGVTVDKQRSERELLAARTWLPVLNLVTHKTASLSLTTNQEVLSKQLDDLAASYKVSPIDATLTLKDASFTLNKSASGQALDITKTSQVLLSTLAKGGAKVGPVLIVVPPKVADANLTTLQKNLGDAQKLSISYKYGTNTKQATAKDIGSWLTVSGTEYSLNTAAIKATTVSIGSGYGIRVKNIDEVTSAITAGLKEKKAVAVTLEAAPVALKSYTYCVALRNVDASYLPGLKAKLQSTYADARGWGLGGQVSFSEVASGCSFTVYLSAAASMTSFGSACDSTWSCTVSPNVILNFNRWTGASPSWNSAGGALEDYRSMVINHETGHWLGFGHNFCKGAGQAAPVMQQQSIDLQGCSFNPWPLASEQSALRQKLGI